MSPALPALWKKFITTPYLFPSDAYPYGAYCDVSLDAENKDDMVDFNIGDEVIVYYDGNIAESYPLQINTVYAISLKDPANWSKNKRFPVLVLVA